MPDYQLHELAYQADPLPRLNAVRSMGAAILLDSADQRSQLGRFSMLCAGPLRQLTSSGNPATDQQHLRAALQQLGPE